MLLILMKVGGEEYSEPEVLRSFEGCFASSFSFLFIFVFASLFFVFVLFVRQDPRWSRLAMNLLVQPRLALNSQSPQPLVL